MAATVHDSAINSANGGSVTIAAFTVDAAVNALLVFLGYGFNTDVDPLFLTVNGVDILANLVWDVFDGGWPTSRAYKVLNPTIGTYAIACTHSTVSQIALGVASIIGADVAGTPFGTPATASATSGTAATVPVVSSSGLIIGFCASDSEGQLDTDAPGVELKKVLNVGSDTAFSIQSRTSVNPTLGWTQTNNRWACGGVGVNAPGGAGPRYILGSH